MGGGGSLLQLWGHLLTRCLGFSINTEISGHGNLLPKGIETHIPMSPPFTSWEGTSRHVFNCSGLSGGQRPPADGGLPCTAGMRVPSRRELGQRSQASVSSDFRDEKRADCKDYLANRHPGFPRDAPTNPYITSKEFYCVLIQHVPDHEDVPSVALCWPRAMSKGPAPGKARAQGHLLMRPPGRPGALRCGDSAH